jgi:hypothetical protein
VLDACCSGMLQLVLVLVLARCWWCASRWPMMEAWLVGVDLHRNHQGSSSWPSTLHDSALGWGLRKAMLTFTHSSRTRDAHDHAAAS